MRILVTRPQAEAQDLAARLRDMGCAPIIEPLLVIKYQEGTALDLAGIQALLVTSANGARAVAAASDRRDLPVFAVGAASAEACRLAGYERIESADGDVDDLADLVIERLDPAKGALLHAAASSIAGNLSKRLTDRGFGYRREILYRAEPSEKLSKMTVALLRGGELEAVSFFSPRTAQTFASLIEASGLTDRLRGMIGYCLSANVAKALAGTTWRDLRIAPKPETESLLRLILEDLREMKDRDPT